MVNKFEVIDNEETKKNIEFVQNAKVYFKFFNQSTTSFQNDNEWVHWNITCAIVSSESLQKAHLFVSAMFILNNALLKYI